MSAKSLIALAALGITVVAGGVVVTKTVFNKDPETVKQQARERLVVAQECLEAATAEAVQPAKGRLGSMRRMMTLSRAIRTHMAAYRKAQKAGVDVSEFPAISTVPPLDAGGPMAAAA